MVRRRRHIGLGRQRELSCLWDAARSGQAQPTSRAPRAIMRQHQVPFQRPSSRPSSSSGRLPEPWRRQTRVAAAAVAGAAARRAAGPRGRRSAGPVRGARAAPGGATGAAARAADAARSAEPPPTPSPRPPPNAGRRQGVSLVPHAPQLTSFGRRDGRPDDKILERAHRGHVRIAWTRARRCVRYYGAGTTRRIASSHGFSQNQHVPLALPVDDEALRAHGPHG